MARRRGVTKSKSVAAQRKVTGQSTMPIKDTRNSQDDPGGGNPQVMEKRKTTKHMYGDLKLFVHNKETDAKENPPVIYKNFIDSTTFNTIIEEVNKQYLHKKFNRLSSTIEECTVNDNGDSKVLGNPSNHNYQQPGDTNKNSNLDSEQIKLNQQSISIDEDSSKTSAIRNTSSPEPSTSRHVCPYCKKGCAKPSVLQKHIRIHTNERPYPCEPCGLEFKTKSNLYKHLRSKSHSLRVQGDNSQVLVEPEELSGSDLDTEENSNTDGQNSLIENITSTEDSTQSIQPTMDNKPYKPKFRNVSLYASTPPPTTEQSVATVAAIHQQSTPISSINEQGPVTAPAYAIPPKMKQNIEERISKLISDNESIVDKVPAPLIKKYPQITRIDSIEDPKLKISLAQTTVHKTFSNMLVNNLKNQQRPIPAVPPVQTTTTASNMSSGQPLNLTKPTETKNDRKRRYSESLASANSTSESTSSVPSPARHPQNPEGSIIKDLLLTSRGLGVPTGEGDDAVFICPLCKGQFSNSENIQYHLQQTCRGPSTQRDNIKYNPLNLANLASLHIPARLLTSIQQSPLTLKHLAISEVTKMPKAKPANIVIPTTNQPTPSTSTGKSNTSVPSNQEISIQCSPISKQSSQAYDTPLPSPGPLLGKTRLVENLSFNQKSGSDKPETASNPYSISAMMQSKNNEINDKSTSTPAKVGRLDILQSSRSSPMDVISPKTTYAMSGGNMKIIEKKDNTFVRFGSSGGSIISMSPQSDSLSEPSPISMRMGLHSGGSIIMDSAPKDSLTPLFHGLSSSGTTITPINSTIFQYPAVPSMLGPMSQSSIPYVPGIPGPHTQLSRLENIPRRSSLSPGRRSTPSPFSPPNSLPKMSQKFMPIPNGSMADIKPVTSTRPIPSIRVESDEKMKSNVPTKNGIWSPANEFNFNRIPNAISPRRNSAGKPQSIMEGSTSECEVRHFNFDHLVGKSETKTTILVPENVANNSTPHNAPLHIEIRPMDSRSSFGERKSDLLMAKVSPLQPPTTSSVTSKQQKFLRPNSLPLKPGTFTPKKHHGITPTAHTMPLISPETPRPSKACIQLYLNGHAYTYLGLKCSTKPFYCTVTRTQPVHFTKEACNKGKSIYSNWQTYAENNPHPLGFKPKEVMSLYDSRQRTQKYTSSRIVSPCVTLSTQSTIMTPFEMSVDKSTQHHRHQQVNFPAITKSMVPNSSLPLVPMTSNSNSSAGSPGVSSLNKDGSGIIPGGYESNEDYTYVRGRGRGKYVCSECGIRCKKPSMLKKHIRTHTDVRPYTCKLCSFSFKTKGNLTKHMKSKTHFRKCSDLNIGMHGLEDDCDLLSNTSGDRTSTIPGDSESELESEGEDGETESSDIDESRDRLPEHEAARCLLSLSRTPPHLSPNLPAGGKVSTSSGMQIHFISMASTATRTSSVKSSSSSSMDNSQSPVPRHFMAQQDSVIQPARNRGVNSFTQPKAPFDSQKHDQYYSNPSIQLRSNNLQKTDETSVPMDLTKPRTSKTPQLQSTASTSNTNNIDNTLSGPATLLSSLSSITDRARDVCQEGVFDHLIYNDKPNDGNLMDAYLKAKAQQNSMFKQSQMSKMPMIKDEVVDEREEPYRKSTPPTAIIPPFNAVKDIKKDPVMNKPNSSVNDTPTKQVNKTHPSIVLPTEIHTPVVVVDSKLQPRVPAKNESVMAMNTLADIAAGSTKLELAVNEQKDEELDKSISKASPPPPTRTDAAQSVAIAYLKVTSKSRSDREDSDSRCSENDSASESKVPSDFSGVLGRKVIAKKPDIKTSNASGERPPYTLGLLQEDSKSVCSICSKTFQKQHQMILHMNIHYMERKFRCDPCGVSFHTQGRLQKHERAESHKNKVMMTNTFGVPTTSNPRPFECRDCKSAFRIHGHLAKHLRCKTHIQNLECLQKLPFGTYAELERHDLLTEIDTTDCDNSFTSLKQLAQKLIEKDPSKVSWAKEQSKDGKLDDGQENGIGESINNHEETSDNACDGNFGDAKSKSNDHELDQQRGSTSTSVIDSENPPNYNNLNGVKQKIEYGTSHINNNNSYESSDELTKNTSNYEPDVKRLKTTSSDI